MVLIQWGDNGMNEVKSDFDKDLEFKIADYESSRDFENNKKCVLCGDEWVDVLNGEDTCNICLKGN